MKQADWTGGLTSISPPGCGLKPRARRGQRLAGALTSERHQPGGLFSGLSSVLFNSGYHLNNPHAHVGAPFTSCLFWKQQTAWHANRDRT